MSKIQTAIEAARKRHEVVQAQSSAPAGAFSAQAVDHTPSSSNGRLMMDNVRRVAVNLETCNANRILTHDTPHPAEGAYRMLRTRLMQNKRSSGWRILGISSINQNEGKTSTAINLAISIAAEIGQEVVLVDLDLRRPSIHTYLGIDADEFTCLTQFLEGGAQNLGDLLICPDIDRLGCLLSAIPLPQPSDVLASPRGKRLFEELRRQLPPETIVIVDLPPLFSTDDALAVAPMLDGLLLVVAEGYTNREDLADARLLVQEFNVIGTLLNKSVEKDNKRTHYDY